MVVFGTVFATAASAAGCRSAMGSPGGKAYTARSLPNADEYTWTADGSTYYPTPHVDAPEYSFGIDDLTTESGSVILLRGSGTGSLRVEITDPEGTKSVWPVPEETMPDPVILPLDGGPGTYRFDVLEETPSGSNFAHAMDCEIEVDTLNEWNPYLMPNAFVSFSEGDEVTSLAKSLTEGCATDLEAASAIYDYLTANIAYDEELAANTPSVYVPVPAETLESGTGIAFDYASLMAAMLRSRGIPASVEIGYLGEMYHAWVAAYLETSGTIGGVFPSGGGWTVIDPTIGAANTQEELKDYLEGRNRYTAIGHY